MKAETLVVLVIAVGAVGAVVYMMSKSNANKAQPTTVVVQPEKRSWIENLALGGAGALEKVF